ncbi:MAG: transglutaminase-like domain-containing protein [Eubacteriales bacterium]|nr:transglutaminase-like domain-containing protein [Eubacteriales bacterium]MDD3200047.1 transglutaminase-like domain-containing protein [Eubacteriales bacterium]MDD4630030.1 transglutaminase-like domain-containing protein [Eubacteriales bacterium]
MKKTKTAIIAAILIVALMITITPVFAFSENESRSVESFFIDTKLLKGDGTGYGLEKTANRLEGIIILLRIMGKEEEALEMQDLPCRFTDVPDWAKGYVNYAYEENISKGVSDTLFGVSEIITADQYNTLLLRVLGYDDSQGDFRWYDSVDKAEDLGILPSDMIEAYLWSNSYTKGDLLDTSFCYLEANYKDQKQTLIGMLIETDVVSDELAETYGLDVKGWDSITTGFNEENYLNFTINEDGNLNISGFGTDKQKSYLLVRVTDTARGTEKVSKVGRMDSSGHYDISLSTGKLTPGEYYVDVYANDERYNYYTSIILSNVILKKIKDDSYFGASPVYGRNLRIHSGNRQVKSDNEMTPNTRSTDENIAVITDLAEEITAGIANDYEKLQAIHDWVAGEIYYDKDFLNGKTKRTNIHSIAVLNNKYAVCSGYSNLMNDLLAAEGIPSRQIIGYTLGVTDDGSWDDLDLNSMEPNHVWNEVFIDGRWIIVDATWDSTNDYESGEFIAGDGVSRLYFDVALQFLSNTHRTVIP